MKALHTLAVATSTLLCVAGLAACSDANNDSTTQSGTTASAGNGKGTIAVVAKAYGTPFYQKVKNGAVAAGEETGYDVSFNGPDNETDTARQSDLLNQVLAKKPAALVFAALDPGAQTANIQAYADANIPVIAFDSGLPDSDIPETTVSTNNIAASALAAEKLVELMGTEGKIAILSHSQTSESGMDRKNGFVDYLKENAPGIEIVDTQYYNSDQAVAQQQASGIIRAHPDLDAIYASNQDGAVAVGQAIKSADKAGKIFVVGFDSGKLQKGLIKDGSISGSITQDPYMMGYEGVMFAVKAIEGEKIEEKFVDSGAMWYTIENIDDPDIEKALYD